MDLWGIIIFLIGIAGYFILRKRARGWAEFSLWVCGIGAGIFIGALWAVYIMESTFSRFDW
jgi:hypothetical protein